MGHSLAGIGVTGRFDARGGCFPVSTFGSQRISARALLGMGTVPSTVRGWMSWRFPLWLQILLTGSVQVTLVCLCGWRRCLCGGVGASAPVCGSGAVSHRGSGEC
ncbi:MAG: hypothetical protein E7D41_02840, partial [Cutibacterium sp.]|nr:hypothetical protein [Cutibacterium sp.]